MGLRELHRRADWYSLSDKERTPVQRLAARSYGLITPANGISMLGLVLTITGLALFYSRQYIIGLSFVGAGRICDIIDGHVARKTRTSSPFGEGLDAAFDKIMVVAACTVLMWLGVLPVVVGVAVLVLQLTVAGLALAVRHDGRGLHPVRIGKYAMFGLWLVIGLFMLAHILPTNGWSQIAWIVAFISSLAVLMAEAQALREYVHIIVHKHLLKR